MALKVSDLDTIMMTHQCELMLNTTAADLTAGDDNYAWSTAPSALGNTKRGTNAVIQYVPINNVRFSKTHPEERINFDNDRIYLYGAPDIDLSFTLRALNHTNIVRVFSTYSKRSLTTGTIPEYQWDFRCTEPKTSSPSTFVIALKGKLVDCEWEKPSDEQTIPLICSARIRVTSQEATVSG